LFFFFYPCECFGVSFVSPFQMSEYCLVHSIWYIFIILNFYQIEMHILRHHITHPTSRCCVEYHFQYSFIILIFDAQLILLFCKTPSFENPKRKKSKRKKKKIIKQRRIILFVRTYSVYRYLMDHLYLPSY
jgi:hypothetical protein